jgi:hypothetical protein
MSKPNFTIAIKHIAELNRQLTTAGLSEAERGPLLAAEWATWHSDTKGTNAILLGILEHLRSVHSR